MPITTRLLIILGFLLLSNLVVAASLTARLNPNPVMQGQTVQLVLQTDGSVNLAGAPDLSPLTKDFMILSQSQSNQISVYNGKTQAQTQWIITLMPKHGGKITIPAIHIGKLASKPLTLTVSNSQPPKQLTNSSANSRNAQNIYLDAKVTPKNPYVQSAMLYTVKIYFNVNIGDANLSDPQAKNADVKPLNNNQNYETIIKGKRYRVFSRSYLITPEQSGKLIIQPPVLNGEAYPSSTVSNMNPLFTVGSQSITKTAPKLTVNVKPKPANFTGNWWLPAKNITLKQQWSQATNQLNIGEPVTRTITITAVGLTASQLPEIKPGNVNNANVYTDAPRLATNILDNQVIGRRTEKIVYIPTQSGKLNFSQIKLPWWNINKHAIAYALLPAKRLDVIAAAGVKTTTQLNPTINNPQHFSNNQAVVLNNQSAPNLKTQQSRQQLESLKLKPSHTSIWFWLAMVLLLLWLATILIWRKPWQRNNNQNQQSDDINGIISQRQSLRRTRDAVIRAAQDNAANTTRDALLAWAQLAFPGQQVKTLNGIIELIDDAKFAKFCDALAKLDRYLYSGQQQEWIGNDFAKLFKDFCKSRQHVTKKKQTKGELPSLYLSD